MVEYEKEYFTKTGYDGYRDWEAHKQRALHIVDIATPRSVLDVGAAYGYTVKHLLEMGIYAVGMDVSEWAEQRSKDIIPHNFVRHDMRKPPYPFRDKEFDLVYCEGVLEHIEEEFIIPIMKEFERISHERIIQVSFSNHKEVEKEVGHINLHDNEWWLCCIPPRTWLAYEEKDTSQNVIWLYKE